jgi:4-diphosphocytidyl-2-C-methyl-D-erythritol kinase
MAVLLINPRVPLSTGQVFKAWDGQDRGPLPHGTAREIAQAGRNDLRDPAISLCPPIAKVLAALEDTSPWLAEMSGSGATCFALYESTAHRDEAAQAIARLEPDWWQMVGKLR